MAKQIQTMGTNIAALFYTKISSAYNMLNAYMMDSKKLEQEVFVALQRDLQSVIKLNSKYEYGSLIGQLSTLQYIYDENDAKLARQCIKLLINKLDNGEKMKYGGTRNKFSSDIHRYRTQFKYNYDISDVHGIVVIARKTPINFIWTPKGSSVTVSYDLPRVLKLKPELDSTENYQFSINSYNQDEYISLSMLDDLLKILTTEMIVYEYHESQFFAKLHTSIGTYSDADPDKRRANNILIDLLEQLQQFDNKLRKYDHQYIFLDILLLRNAGTFYEKLKYDLKNMDISDPEFDILRKNVYRFVSEIISFYSGIINTLYGTFRARTRNFYQQNTYIIDDIIKNNLKPNEIANGNFYNVSDITLQIESLVKTYLPSVVAELVTMSAQLITEKNTLSIEPPSAKYIYADYYSNRGSVTEKWYRLLVISQYPIAEQFAKIDKILSKLYDLDDATRYYLNARGSSGARDIKTIVNDFYRKHGNTQEQTETLVAEMFGELQKSIKLKPSLNDQNLTDAKQGLVQFFRSIPKPKAKQKGEEKKATPLIDLSDGAITAEQYNKLMTHNDSNFREIIKSQWNTTINISILRKNIVAYICHVIFKTIQDDVRNNLDSINAAYMKLRASNNQHSHICEIATRTIQYFTTALPVLLKFAIDYLEKEMTILKRDYCKLESDSVQIILLFDDDPRFKDQLANLNTVDDILSSITAHIDRPLYDSLVQETKFAQTFIDVEQKMIEYVRKDSENMQNHLNEFHQFSLQMDLIMFNKEFMSRALIKQSDLLERRGQTITNYKAIVKMIQAKLYDIGQANFQNELTKKQITNYIIYVMNVYNIFPEDEDMYKKARYYERLSFGLVDYYNDIVTDILTCLKKKPYDEMHQVEKFLVERYDIQLHRLAELFHWLMQTYLTDKQAAEQVRKRAGTKIPPNEAILAKKIELIATTGDVSAILTEFNGIKDLLDSYRTAIMPNISLFLRINDFAVGSDLSPTDIDYKESEQVFKQNEKNPRKLIIDWKNIPALPSGDKPQELYRRIDKQMILSDINKGITFERIFTTQKFPDSSVIGNYMSIAPNIKQQRGTTIMTYGYSGVGKTVSLFGNDNTQGILQSVLSNFSGGDDFEIFLRVFEIYGLGMPYDFYWNPTVNDDGTGGPLCYPDIFQVIIHHDLGIKSAVLIDNKSIPITNKYEQYAYIMNLEDPEKNRPQFIPNNKRAQYNVALKELLDPGNKFKVSTYVKIDEPHYRTFDKFIKQLDDRRKQGIDLKTILECDVDPVKLKQIKSTVNNPESSRSITVFDFQVKFNESGSGNPVFVPFVIYDLPGKEDLYKTYVEPDEHYVDAKLKSTDKTTAKQLADINTLKAAVFKNLPEDKPITRCKEHPIRERKSTFVMNPMLSPLYVIDSIARYQAVIEIFKKLDKFDFLYPTANLGSPKKPFISVLVEDVLHYVVTGYQLAGKKDNYEQKLYGLPLSIYTYYNKPYPQSFKELFDINNIKITISMYEELVIKYGLFSMDQSKREGGVFYNVAGSSTTNDDDKLKNLFLVQVMIIVMRTLIKFNLFHVIVEVINVLADEPSWKPEKIYEFFEAYYINENIMGLLSYLILNASKSKTAKKINVFPSQPKIFATDITNKLYKMTTLYILLKNKANADDQAKNRYTFSDITIPKEARESEQPNEKKSIKELMKCFDVEEDGSFYKAEVPFKKLYETFRMAIEYINKGNYDNNKIFRDSSRECEYPTLTNKIIDPFTKKLKTETNRPFLQDLMEPYSIKIENNYVFYVVSNTQKDLKANEQVKLLNNSMPIVDQLYTGDDPSQKKTQCAQ